MALEILTQRPEQDTGRTPILFVHGGWHGAWCWDEYFLKYFAWHGYEARALSLRGHASSDPPNRLWHRIADYLDDLVDVAQGLRTPPILVGHSMGGLIIQKYLGRHPSPAAILLASTPPVGALRAIWRSSMNHPSLVLHSTLTMRLSVSTSGLAQRMFFSPEMPKDEVVRHFERLKSESWLAILDTLMHSSTSPRNIQTPLLVLGAGSDALLTRKEVEATANAFGTQAEFIPHVAHDMMLDPGWEAVAERIVVWLRTQGL